MSLSSISSSPSSSPSSLRTGAVIRILGRLLLVEALMLLLPLVVSVAYGGEDWECFAVAFVAATVAGGVTELCTRHVSVSVRAREGFVITALVWVVYGLFGMIPFMLCSRPLGFTDAMFEVISGFTTTGASMITDVEACSHGILMWRALTQWIGGLGIVFFMLAVLPEFNKPTGISMFNAEATGITHSKLHPRIRQTAISVWGVYVALTVLSVLLLWAGPMNLFDSVCQTFAAVATGGFSTRNIGVAYWGSDYVMVVLTFVMFVAGVNFMTLYGAFRSRSVRELMGNDVFRTFAWVVAGAYVLMMLQALSRTGGDWGGSRPVDTLFHVVSAITSTGFSVPGAEGWGSFALFMTILLMVCGACTGSTSGGIKVDRFLVLGRNVVNEIKRTVFPKRTYVVRLGGAPLDGGVVSRILAFVSLYILTVIVSTGIVTMSGYSFTDALFMVCSCIGCNGLGYGVTGAEGSFALLPCGVKWLLVFDMLVGRLELFTFLVLFVPSFWKR